MDKFEDLQAFVAVVEAGSFTGAAERLGAAKSAVSRRVSALEERLGVQLLRRTTRTQNLTETGRSFYEHSARILADLEEAESAVQQEHGELRGTLRVALPLSFGVRHMCKPIASFSRLHPKIRFDLDLNDRRIDLVEEGMDLAIRIGHLPDSSLIARRLFDVRSVVCASPHYLSVHGEPQSPEDLAEHDCLVYSNLPDPDTWRWIFEFARAKAAHLVEYAILFLLANRAFRNGRRAWIFCVVYAVTDEFHQTFVPYRSGRPMDVGIDALGAGLAWFWAQRRARRAA